MNGEQNPVVDVDFTMKILNPALTPHESLRAEFSLENIGRSPAELPSPYDRTDALTIRVYDSDRKLLRTMSGFTSQAMMSRSRIDERRDLDRLAPGQRWSWDLDLCQFHYPLPAGELLVDASYRFPPEGLNLDSERIPVHVAPARLTAVSLTADNPVTERLHVVLEAAENGNVRHFLANYNYRSPLAAWYSTEVLRGIDARSVFASSAGTYQSASFDPASSCWLVWEHQSVLRARWHEGGSFTGRELSGPVPPGCGVVPFASHDLSGALVSFLNHPDGSLGCHRMLEDRLEEVFIHPQEHMPGLLRSIAVRNDAIHLVTAGPSLTYERLSPGGELQESRELFRSRLMPECCRLDPFTLTATAAFRDAPHGRTFDLVAVTLDGGKTFQRRIDQIGLRHPINEFSVDIDRHGRFHFLLSTTERKLYYGASDRGLHLLAVGQDRFFPHILHAGKIYLGYWTTDLGYRYILYDRRRRGSHVIDFEEYFP